MPDSCVTSSELKQAIIWMTVSIEIRHASDSPTSRKTWAPVGADESVVIQIQDRRLARIGVLKHKIRVTVAAKVGYCRPRSQRWSRRSDRQCEGISFFVRGVVNAAASDNAGIPFPRTAHYLVCATAGINHITSIAIVSVQPLVTSTTGYPYDHVIRAVRRGNKD